MRALRWLWRGVIGLCTLALLLIVVLLAASYFYDRSQSAGRPVTALWHGRFVEANGVLTAYRQWGSSGSPIVLLGGFLEPSFVWDAVGPLLARAGHRVYALDLDGFGYSERRGPWTLAEWANQTQGFMRALGLERPVVVGHSLGAAVAVEVAARGAASRAVLVDGDALTTGGPPHWLAVVISKTPLVTAALGLATAWDWPVREILSSVYEPAHPQLDHASVIRWTDQFRALGAGNAITHLIGNGIQGFSPRELHALHIAATVVWGGKDGIDSLAAGRATARDLRARFLIVPGAGHLAILTNPGAVARAVEVG